jgi:hypothetical protein
LKINGNGREVNSQKGCPSTLEDANIKAPSKMQKSHEN